MKKKTLMLSLLLIITVLMTACAPRTATKQPSAPAGQGYSAAKAFDRAEDRIDEAEDRAEDHAEHNFSAGKAGADGSVSTADRTPLLSAEEAQTIALDHAGVAADAVRGLRCEFDIDDGVKQYEVSFRLDRVEYEYEIHADSGEILSYDKDMD